MDFDLGVVFHVNDASSQKQRAALKNISNLLAEMPEIPVELVVQGDAINLVVSNETTLAQELAALQQQGVVIAVCHNTMKAKGVTEAELLPGMTIVPSAVGELVRRQRQGLAYIKP
ncbi:DsrE family protein [Sulfobacillus thermosulfidooxidans]|uniref:Uncharacterized protein n=2 Tax=Sulfobacillus thermosulfidooxidans TaxID=28034 RepID=A0A1W1W9Q3_SULTA|nr:DsrE family protein [Sulfobacillus thermosulfidooxidans]SMC02463.1 hypothetical protein SAMN00768000_0608 [Sulfobacillus thermosulfidooxidans DSM 9293]OLZ10487.1 hypothetical protein BFX05_01210 [Sulfobacillus thermosulfidooxidans]OLZ14257.1 hypothetical protein BFX06_08210 [Sulfobacillus thermosulfidooxidans]OLZ19000.1 hypothetical protein BFX07_04605 [Sulfobacillus thermosulfidooxidans]PSR28624.1 MAG: hypothetical protein C7B47_05555 [Sulfobacillus thermosulfidooxidans]